MPVSATELFGPPAAKAAPVQPPVGRSAEDLFDTTRNAPARAADSPVSHAYAAIKPYLQGGEQFASGLLGEVASLTDMVLSTPGMILGTGAEYLQTAQNLLNGMSVPKAYAQGVAEGRDVASTLGSPIHKLLSFIHEEKPYDASKSQKALEDASKKMHSFWEEYSAATGGRFPAAAGDMFTDTLMSYLAGKGTDLATKGWAEKLDRLGKAKPPKESSFAEARKTYPKPTLDEAKEEIERMYTDWAHGLEPEEPVAEPPAAAKPRIKLRVTPKGAAAGIGAGAVALAMTDSKYRKQLEDAGLIGGALLAVKGKGGMWHPEAVERLSLPLNERIYPVAPEWARKSIRNYLNRYAGTAEDPLKDVEIPFREGTKRWEELTDAALVGKPAETWHRTPTTAKTADETVWGLRGPEVGYLEMPSKEGAALTSYLSHVGDYLRQNVDPAKLQQYDLVRAVKETAKNDERVAREMEKAAAASTKDLPIYKDYTHDNPGTLPGMKWVELKKPEKLTEEQAKGIARANDLHPEGAEKARGHYVALAPDGKPITNTYTGTWAAGKDPEEAYLAGQLAQEGNQMGHCVGGYCEGVASGESRIFSLRDAKGKSHVTIEVAPAEKTEAELRRAQAAANRSNQPWEVDPELAKPKILQIKGKQNRAPNPEYLPYVQDFVRSGNWGEVGDLENADLRSTSTVRRYAEQHGDQAMLNWLNKEEAGQKYVSRTKSDAIRDKTEGVARREAGRANPEILFGLAGAALGAAGGAYLDPNNPILAAIEGGTAGLFMVGGIHALFKASPEAAAAARTLSDRLFTIQQRAMERQLAMLRYVKSVVPPNYADMAPDIYRSYEDPSVKLSPEAAEVKAKIIDPIMKGNKLVVQALKKMGVEVPEMIEHYVHRVPVSRRGSIFDQPVIGRPFRRGLSRTAPALQERTVFALEAPSGRRLVVTDEGGGTLRVWHDGKVGERIKVRGKKPIQFEGQEWKRAQASTDEIERETKIRYYHDALGGAIDSNIRLGRALDNALFLEGLKQLPEWGDVAMKPGDHPPVDWRSVNIPQLQGWRFAPQVAEALDDFAGEARVHIAEGLQKLNRILIGSMFWDPLPHIDNVLLHAFANRGLTPWLTPQGWWRLARTGVKAFREVYTAGPEYRRFLHEGAGFVYPRTILRNFSEQIMNHLGTRPEMDGVAKAFGYLDKANMIKHLYGLSRRSLWFWNDTILMQAFLEKEELAKKASPREVIDNVEKHVPGYRVPERILGSRMIAQAMQSPLIFAFGRYDYARLRSYGEMVKDLIAKGVPLRDRAKALDQMAAVGVGTFIIYPYVLDRVAQAITGNPNATFQRFGPATIPWMLYEYFHGGKDLSDVVESAFPLSPIPKLFMEWYYNRDLHTGNRLLETPKDLENWVRDQINPLYISGQVSAGKMTPEQFFGNAVGVKSPSEGQVIRREKYRQREATEKRRRERREERQ